LHHPLDLINDVSNAIDCQGDAVGYNPDDDIGVVDYDADHHVQHLGNHFVHENLQSGWRESNPHFLHGKQAGYHYITPAVTA
jgi:hypothetical protein